jgi:hypothetical protein
MAARVPKKKRASSVATFPNLTLLGVFCKAGSSVVPLGVVFFFIVFLGWLHESGRCPFWRAENRLRLYYYTMAWVFGVMLIGIWFCGFWRECVCVNRNDEWEGYPIGIRYKKCSRWLSLFLLQS